MKFTKINCANKECRANFSVSVKGVLSFRSAQNETPHSKHYSGSQHKINEIFDFRIPFDALTNSKAELVFTQSYSYPR